MQEFSKISQEKITQVVEKMITETNMSGGINWTQSLIEHINIEMGVASWNERVTQLATRFNLNVNEVALISSIICNR